MSPDRAARRSSRIVLGGNLTSFGVKNILGVKNIYCGINPGIIVVKLHLQRLPRPFSDDYSDSSDVRER